MKKSVQRALLAAATLLLAAPLAACSGSPGQLSERDYLDGVRQIGTFPEATDEEAISLGEDLCSELDQQGGASGRSEMIEEFIAGVADANGSRSDAERFVELATRRFCVEFAV